MHSSFWSDTARSVGRYLLAGLISIPLAIGYELLDRGAPHRPWLFPLTLAVGVVLTKLSWWRLDVHRRRKAIPVPDVRILTADQLATNAESRVVFVSVVSVAEILQGQGFAIRLAPGVPEYRSSNAPGGLSKVLLFG